MGKEVTAVFDIGKTNKKFFLFDRDFHEVHREYTHLESVPDEDGYPSENLQALTAWMRAVLHRALDDPQWDIHTLNFSTYGASLVHLDNRGEPLTPLYNYTKPYEPSLEDAFYAKYGPQEAFERHTGASRSGMLNSGLQLYWLKNRQPGTYSKIKGPCPNAAVSLGDLPVSMVCFEFRRADSHRVVFPLCTKNCLGFHFSRPF